MQPLGTLLLHLAFILTALTGLVGIAAAVLRDDRALRAARYGMLAAVFVNLAMAGVLWHGYFSHEFASKYIATYSDKSMPLIYLFTSFWGGEKGALLFWVTILSIFAAIAVHQARDRDVSYVGWAIAILSGATFFYDILMVFEANPFETFLTFDGPRDGQGLNPLLQNPTMAIHPPSLLTGFIAFTVPFAFGASSLITGRLDDQWARDTRKWTIVSWLFLTTGLVLGGAWAYQELGWGGFWMWDPVENAGLIPWFTAGAFLHSIIVQERYGMLRRWNFTLVCLTFLLTIFGTFLTRSQLIVSIHAFADSKLSEYFLGYMILIGVVSTGLLAWRWKAMKAETRIQSFLSREAFFVLNNVLMLLCAFIVMWGTLYSKISASETFRAGYNAIASGLGAIGIPMDTIHAQQELGEPWFNKVMIPAGVALLILTAIGPLVAWRRTTWTALNKTFTLPFVLATVPMLLGTIGIVLYRSFSFGETVMGSAWDGYQLWALTVEGTDLFAFVTIWFALFVMTGVAVEYWRGGRIRQKKRGGSMAGSMLVLALRAKRRYVGYIVHVGMALVFLGFAGSAFKKHAPETPLHTGESLSVGNYTVTFVGMHERWIEGAGYMATQTDVLVMERGETAPTSDVAKVTAYLTARGMTPVHVETRPNSPKIILKFDSAEHRERVREELYVSSVLKERFQLLPRRAGDGPTALRFGFKDERLIQAFPPIIHKQVDDVRRSLGSLRSGRGEVMSTPGVAEFTVKWPSEADVARFQALWRNEEPSIPGLLMVRVDPVEDALEVALDGTGYRLQPEVRRYVKHMNPTTEVAIWSRLHEDVYLAMRPDMGQPFINLLAFVNPMINLLWLGTIVIFLGSVLLLVPTDFLLGREGAAAGGGTAEPEPAPLPPTGAVSTAKISGGTSAVFAALLLGSALTSAPAAALTDTSPGPEAAHVLDSMRCACESGGERVFDDNRRLTSCDCPYGAAVKRRIVLAIPSGATREQQLSFLSAFIEEEPTNERFLLADDVAHRDLMHNTWCVCGCGRKPFSQCPLDCAHAPYWQKLFKVLLVLGYSTAEARAYYVEQINGTMRKAEDPPFTVDQIWLNRESALSWWIPASIGVAAVVVIALTIVIRTRRNAAVPERERDPAETAAVDRFRDDIDDLGV